MLKLIKYLLSGFIFFTSCESVYVPDLDVVENVMVVDARLIYGQQENKIILQNSSGFNEKTSFDPITTARVILTDDLGVENTAIQQEPGVYSLYGQLDSMRQYKLLISDGGDTYSSGFEGVPPVPHIDTIYSDHAEQWIQPGGENSTGDFLNFTGQQLFVDIDNEESEIYFRFTARKILQYYFPFDTVLYGQKMVEYKFAWKSFYAQDSYNIAGPPEYSSQVDITKHPVEFFRYNDQALLDTTERALGWIYIMHQYRISGSAYNFYKDLNSQLEASGKIFDPLYVQARNNIECVSNPAKIVLGNFEIASYREHRYYIRLNVYSGKHTIRPIEVFHDIPPAGVIPLTVPWFWEH